MKTGSFRKIVQMMVKARDAKEGITLASITTCSLGFHPALEALDAWYRRTGTRRFTFK